MCASWKCSANGGSILRVKQELSNKNYQTRPYWYTVNILRGGKYIEIFFNCLAMQFKVYVLVCYTEYLSAQAVFVIYAKYI